VNSQTTITPAIARHHPLPPPSSWSTHSKASMTPPTGPTQRLNADANIAALIAAFAATHRPVVFVQAQGAVEPLDPAGGGR
jgi:hypothetical protein